MTRKLTILFALLLLALCSPAWAAYPTVLFNSSTGSNTAASGAGPATAIYGTSATTYNVATTTVSLLGGVDLSGVAVDGSAALWIKTASGRQYSSITGKNDTTDKVLVADSFTITTSGLTWAIGGKRATLDHADSRTAFSTTGASGGWIIELEDNQTLSATYLTLGATGNTAVGFITFRGSAGSIKTISQSAAAHALYLSGANWIIKNIKLQNTSGTPSNGILSANDGTKALIIDCIIGDATNRLSTGLYLGGSAITEVVNSEIKNCTSNGILAGDPNLKVFGCSIHNNGAAGVAAGLVHSITDSLIYSNTTNGISFTTLNAAYWTPYIRNNTIHGNGAIGIYANSATAAGVVIVNNNITANGTYGIRGNAILSRYALTYLDYNNFGTGASANTSGAYLNLAAGAHDFAIDPGYVSAATGNFTVTAAGLLGVGFPGTGYIGAGQSLTRSYVDIGAAQTQAVTADYPAVSYVYTGIGFNNAQSTGTLMAASAANVRYNTATSSLATTTGTLRVAGAGYVTSGTLTDNTVGNVVLPAADKVENLYMFGPNKLTTGTLAAGGGNVIIIED